MTWIPINFKIDPDVANDLRIIAENRGQTTSELLRELVRDFIETKEGKRKQAERLEIEAQQLRKEIQFIEEREAQKKKHMEEMNKIEEEKKQKQEELELERQEQARIKEEVLKIWQRKGSIEDVSPDLRPKVEEKLAEWKAKEEEWSKSNKKSMI